MGQSRGLQMPACTPTPWNNCSGADGWVSDSVGLSGARDEQVPGDAAVAWVPHFENHGAVAVNNSNTSVTQHDKIVFPGQAKSPAGPGNSPRPSFSVR